MTRDLQLSFVCSFKSRFGVNLLLRFWEPCQAIMGINGLPQKQFMFNGHMIAFRFISFETFVVALCNFLVSLRPVIPGCTGITGLYLLESLVCRICHSPLLLTLWFLKQSIDCLWYTFSQSSLMLHRLNYSSIRLTCKWLMEVPNADFILSFTYNVFKLFALF